MDQLFLVKSHVDINFLRSWGDRHQHMVRQDDFGYVIHALLEMLFRKDRPKSFYFDRSCDILYFYSKFNSSQLAQQLINKNKAACCGLGLGRGYDYEVTDITSMIAIDQILSFEVVTVVTKRLTGSRKEVDVFSAAEGSEQERYAAYKKWLHAHVTKAGFVDVNIVNVVIEQHSVLRREKRIFDLKNRKQTVINVPIAKFFATFRVDTRQRFLENLLKGIGRHKTFGFGMLMIKK